MDRDYSIWEAGGGEDEINWHINAQLIQKEKYIAVERQLCI